ncbi:MAG: hypothetical protein K0R54_5085 [Clostridiaceae bacterium]|jgi:hypothetical protein|nr:hypothetical protein [Clostridiaceae bacterium]
MKELLISQVLIPIIGTIISTLLGIALFYVKKFYNKHKDFLELQREQLIQKIGIDKYNHDVVVVKNAVKAVEQIAKENDWKGTLKQTKVLDMIQGKTGLTDEQIFNVIKGTVLEVNNMKSTAVQK